MWVFGSRRASLRLGFDTSLSTSFCSELVSSAHIASSLETVRDSLVSWVSRGPRPSVFLAFSAEES